MACRSVSSFVSRDLDHGYPALSSLAPLQASRRASPYAADSIELSSFRHLGDRVQLTPFQFGNRE
jgi:hypothetical protein